MALLYTIPRVYAYRCAEWTNFLKHIEVGKMCWEIIKRYSVEQVNIIKQVAQEKRMCWNCIANRFRKFSLGCKSLERSLS